MRFTLPRARFAAAAAALFGYSTEAATPATAPAATPSTDINLTSYANGAWILKIA